MERTLGDATHMAPALPVRKTDHLHRHRVSLPGCRYFLTFCALRPVDVLTHPALGQRLLAQIRELFTGQDATFLCATLMPDHATVLFRLGDRLTLGQLAGKFKAKTAAALEQHGAVLAEGLYDRRLHSGNCPVISRVTFF
ncbi:MAG: transposase [Kiritimatiellia bacterium]